MRSPAWFHRTGMLFALRLGDEIAGGVDVADQVEAPGEVGFADRSAQISRS